ncbi:MAG: YdcF family protein [Pseudolabrys sp.]|jgi:uncharacterized SAM-binding protein YcdF (DUF218 family)
MFFILAKTVTFLLLPSNVLLLIGLAGLVLLFTRWRRVGTRLMAASLLLMALAAFLPLAALLIHPLETRFPPWNPARGAPDGIVVLGGAIGPALSRIYGATQLNGSAERVTAIAKLAREYPKARIIYSGGDASLFANQGREADYLYPLLESFGVPRARVELESRARNTYENAVFSKALAKPKPGERWLLVTSAEHMPRAIGCFRRVGFPVEAYPVDWHTGPRLQLSIGEKFGSRLAGLDRATHAWLGLLAYWLTGRTSAFLPGPAAP